MAERKMPDMIITNAANVINATNTTIATNIPMPDSGFLVFYSITCFMIFLAFVAMIYYTLPKCCKKNAKILNDGDANLNSEDENVNGRDEMLNDGDENLNDRDRVLNDGDKNLNSGDEILDVDNKNSDNAGNLLDTEESYNDDEYRSEKDLKNLTLFFTMLVISLVIADLSKFETKYLSFETYYCYQMGKIVLMFLVMVYGFYMIYSDLEIRFNGHEKILVVVTFLLLIVETLGCVAAFKNNYIILGITIIFALIQKPIQLTFITKIRYRRMDVKTHNAASIHLIVLAVLNFSLWIESLVVSPHENSVLEKISHSPSVPVLSSLYGAFIADYRLTMAMIFIQRYAELCNVHDNIIEAEPQIVHRQENIPSSIIGHSFQVFSFCCGMILTLIVIVVLAATHKNDGLKVTDRTACQIMGIITNIIFSVSLLVLILTVSIFILIFLKFPVLEAVTDLMKEEQPSVGV